MNRCGTAALKDVEIYYEMQGRGPYLTLVPGLGVGTWIWERQLDAFARHFTTVIFDNRGMGKSSKPPGPYRVSQMTGDLLGLLDFLGIGETHLLGISLGGFIALETALSAPERINRLVLVSTAAGGADQVPMAPEVLQLLLKTTGGRRELIREKLSLAFSEAFLSSPEIDRLVEVRLADRQPSFAFTAQAAAGAAFDRSADAAGVRQPTLIIAGSGDRVVPARNAEILAAKISGSRCIIYPKLGHQCFYEDAASFNADVVEFLTDGRLI